MVVRKVRSIVLVNLYRTILVEKCESLPIFNFDVLLIVVLVGMSCCGF